MFTLIKKMNKPIKIEGRAWVVRTKDNNALDDIDTDQIYHNSHLAITDINFMGQYALGNLKGWENFYKSVQKGDILIACKNFGAGSSRQQAVDCFVALGISLLICESYGAIYKRNAINSGLPILTCPDITRKDKDGIYFVNNGDILEINLITKEITNQNNNKKILALNFSSVQMDIYQAGNLFIYGKFLNSA